MVGNWVVFWTQFERFILPKYPKWSPVFHRLPQTVLTKHSNALPAYNVRGHVWLSYGARLFYSHAIYLFSAQCGYGCSCWATRVSGAYQCAPYGYWTWIQGLGLFRPSQVRVTRSMPLSLTIVRQPDRGLCVFSIALLCCLVGPQVRATRSMPYL